MQETDRRTSLDVTKGILIILVVLGHLLQGFYGMKIADNFVFKAIYSFHMPLFMGISGYIAGKKDGIDHKWIIRRSLLLIPCFFWGLVYSDIHGMDDLVYSIHTISRNAGGMLWFLFCLFEIHLCYFFSHEIHILLKIREELVFGAVVLIAFCCDNVLGVNEYGVGQIGWFGVFYFAGMISAKHNWRIKIWMIICIPLWLIGVVLWDWETKGIIFLASVENMTILIKGFNYVFHLSLSFLGILTVLFFQSVCSFRRIERLFAWIGGYTLEIYIVHELLLMYIGPIRFWWTIPIFTVLGVIISIIIANVFYSGILCLFIFGKKKTSVMREEKA